MKKIEDGSLIRVLIAHSPLVSRYRYGTVLDTRYPMKDDHDWADHYVLWHDGTEPTWEWCGDIDWVADE